MSEWDNLTAWEEGEKNNEIRVKADKHSEQLFISWAHKALIARNLDNIRVFELLEFIRTGKWKKKIENIRLIKDKKERSKAKLQLGYVTFGAILKHRELKEHPENLIKATGLMTLDWDEAYEDEKVLPIKKIICEDKHVYACFRSPSGALKYVIKIPEVKDDAEYKEFYEGARQYYNNKGLKLDTSGKDINRCCFVSYDPDLYYNPDCETFTTRIKVEEKKKVVKDNKNKELVKVENNTIPKQCDLIENFYSKIYVESTGEVIKHTHVDPNVYNYCVSNGKQIIFENYKSVQGRTNGAFNGAENVDFNCGALINFAKGSGNKEQLKHCVGCPYLQEYFDEVEDFEVVENPTRQEVSIYLNKLSESKNNLFIDEKLREIAEKTEYKLGVLREDLKDKKKKSKYIRSNNATYYFDKSNFGTFFYKKQYNEKTNEDERHDISSFKILKKENRTDINLFDMTTKLIESNICAVPLIRPEGEVNAENELETSYLLEFCKHGKNYVLQPDDIGEFINKYNYDETIEKVDSQQVNMYAYQNKKYYEPKEYGCYNEIQRIVNGERHSKKVKGLKADDYVEFINISADKEIINQCVNDLNDLPVNLEDAQVWKGILCKSISMMLKMELVSLGVQFFPIDIIMGEKGTGKTTLNKLLVRCLWNSVPRNNSEMSGSIGARLDYPNDIRPLVYEELTEFKSNWVDMLKEGMTRGVFTIKKGTPDQGMNIKYIYQNFFLDTNEFNVNDQAFEERMCFWQKNVKLDGKDNLDVVYNLEQNIKHLGKNLYDNFIKLDTKRLWEEANKYIVDLNITGNIRKRIKFAQIRFGELILKQVYPKLFEFVIIDYDKILDDKSYFLFNKEDYIKDKIRFVLSKIVVRVPNSPDYTITKCLSDYESDNINDARSQLFDKYGLIISTGGELCITRNFLPILNNETDKIKKFTNLNELSSIINSNNKRIKYSLNGFETTKWAISIMSLLIDEEEKEEDEHKRLD